jgi:hypothetical protein
MSIDVDTKDCTALSDAEIAEMADLCAEGPITHEIGIISKQVEEWVLVTQARQGNKLKGFSFCTLERIGGTPAVIIGVGAIQRSSKRDTVLRAVMGDQLRRAVLAFPDEDVLVCARFADSSGYEAYKALNEIVPRDGHRASGEERAWGRRIAKRLSVPPSRYDDRTFVVTGDNNPPLVFDHESLHPEKNSDFDQFFAGFKAKRGDSVIAFGWAMAEDLAKLA